MDINGIIMNIMNGLMCLCNCIFTTILFKYTSAVYYNGCYIDPIIMVI